MKVISTDIPDVVVLEPKVFSDERGLFFETYNRRTFRQAVGLDPDFVQDNQSRSMRNVLRGLHYQVRQSQGKLLRVTFGRVFDVAVDLRRSSPTFGRWTGVELTAESRRMVWIPPGFAHGFLVLSDQADVQYKTTEYYAPEFERAMLWCDPAVGIRWPLEGPPIVSHRDAAGRSLGDAETFP